MKRKPTTVDLGFKKVTQLLQIGMDSNVDESDEGQCKADVLSDCLSDTLAVHAPAKEKLDQLQHTICVLSGESVGKLLFNEKTYIDIIRMIKGYGRKLSTCAESEAEHQASNTIYYAAIAHALVYHDQKTTKLSYDDLSRSFDRLCQEDWIPIRLRNLFEKSAECCRRRKN